MNVKRRYSSTARRRQALETRRRLLESARRRFAAQGFADTTIQQIAQDAGVSVQTFYAVHGSKRAVLHALLDEMEAQADVSALRSALVSHAGDADEQLRLIVDFNVTMFHEARDILAVLRRAGAEAEPEVVQREGDDRRRSGQRAVVEEWARLGALGPGRDPVEAADVLWAMTGPEVYDLFVQERGWEPERFRDWLLTALRRDLFS